MKIHVLYKRSYHFDIIRKQQRQCFECIWEAAHAKEKKEWVFGTPLCIGMVPENFLATCTLVYPSRSVCFNPPHDGITETEGLHFRQKKSVLDGVKGLGKIKIDKISCGAFVHHARHRKLEEQQIGETGPAWWEIMLMR